MTSREFDLTRCKEVWELRNKKNKKGKSLFSFEEIGLMVGVSESRASMMFDTYDQHKLLEEARSDYLEWLNMPKVRA